MTGRRHTKLFEPFYIQLPNQQQMLEDTPRTGTYHWAIMRNRPDFVDKVVLDLGSGTGILALWAAQAGARKVYAVETSPMAENARKLITANGWAKTIEVIRAHTDDLELPERVDVIISEILGIFLIHERALEGWVTARSRWLKRRGKMYPAFGRLYVAPFSDSYLHNNTHQKSRFWEQTNFFGYDLSAIAREGRDEHFARPVVGRVNAEALLSEQAARLIDFRRITAKGLNRLRFDFEVDISRDGVAHGLAGWFDVTFDGCNEQVVLSTAPQAQTTHWYQTRFLFKDPVPVHTGQRLAGTMSMSTNDRGSYDIKLTAKLDGMVVAKQQYALYRHRYWWGSAG
ncbi:methyltransferase domain-containing protein [Myxococcota bacterium]